MKQEMNMELSPPIKKSSQGDEDQNSAVPSTEKAPQRSPTLDAAHTPLPWRVRVDGEWGEPRLVIEGNLGATSPLFSYVVCADEMEERRERAQADYALIVAAVNAYVPHRFAAMNALVDAAQSALTTLRTIRDQQPDFWNTLVDAEVCGTWDKLRAALKLANSQRTDTPASGGTTQQDREP